MKVIWNDWVARESVHVVFNYMFLRINSLSSYAESYIWRVNLTSQAAFNNVNNFVPTGSNASITPNQLEHRPTSFIYKFSTSRPGIYIYIYIYIYILNHKNYAHCIRVMRCNIHIQITCKATEISRCAVLLTHFPLDKVSTISQTIFSNVFSGMKSFTFWSKFVHKMSIDNNTALV